VYDDAHIGNFRSFLAADVLRRFLESPLCEVVTRDGTTHQGPRRVTHVMNITDVGHMTDDAEGGESGEDRMAVAGRRIEEAKKSGKLPVG
jgi:cysteinyl-tRNA synthetase